ncbi:MAG: hypothetical protein Q7S96_01325 [bacterium]|nr:hypothetical protein [bacterium]
MFSRFVFFGIIVLLTEVFHLSFIIAAASMLGIVAVATIALPKDTRHA